MEEVMERAMKINNEPRDVAMGRGVVDDLVGEIAAIIAVLELPHTIVFDHIQLPVHDPVVCLTPYDVTARD